MFGRGPGEGVLRSLRTGGLTRCVCVCVCPGGGSRASGMLLVHRPQGSQDSQQVRMEAVEDRREASWWLGAMHKVRTHTHTHTHTQRSSFWFLV